MRWQALTRYAWSFCKAEEAEDASRALTGLEKFKHPCALEDPPSGLRGSDRWLARLRGLTASVLTALRSTDELPIAGHLP